MSAAQVIFLLVVAAVLLLIFFFFAKPARTLLKLGVNAVAGCLGLWAANALLAGTSLAVGANAVTVLTVGILGLPGFLLLFVTKLVL